MTIIIIFSKKKHYLYINLLIDKKNYNIYIYNIIY